MTSVTGRPPVVLPAVDKGGFRFVAQVTGEDSAAAGPRGWIERAEWPFQRQAEEIYTSLAKLTADAAGLDGMCRQHIYQRNKRYYPAFERTRIAFEPDTPTPSSGIGVDPLGARRQRTYEVDGIALSPAGIERYGVPAVYQVSSIGASASHYTQALIAGPYVFTAGMIAVDPATATSISGYDDVPEEGRLLKTGRTHPDSRTGPVAAQTWSLYRRIFGMLEEGGIGAERIVSATVFLSDPGDVADFLRVHSLMFGGWTESPALQLVFVDEVGHHGTVVEIEVTAVVAGHQTIVRTAGFDHAGPPAVVRTGELAFSSDALALNGEQEPVTSLDELRQPMRDLLAGHRESIAEPLLAQIGGVTDGVLEALEAAGVPRGSVGSFCLRIADREMVGAATAVVTDLLGADQVALTVLGGETIGHWPGVLAVGSAVCAGVIDA